MSRRLLSPLRKTEQMRWMLGPWPLLEKFLVPSTVPSPTTPTRNYGRMHGSFLKEPQVIETKAFSRIGYALITAKTKVKD